MFDDERIILVDNALECLQQLAAWHRQEMPARVIGIGGSNGKTTTKELMVSVFSTIYETHFTPGNLNNHIGVPLTLLGLRPSHQLAVVELGTNRAGDIEELCKIETPERKTSEDPIFLIARSLDINKPGTELTKLHGGVLGGALKQGTLKIGDEIEIKPGYSYKKQNQNNYNQ